MIFWTVVARLLVWERTDTGIELFRFNERVESSKQICAHVTSCVQEIAVSGWLLLCHHPPILFALPSLAHEPIDGEGRCPGEGMVSVFTGIISLLYKQPRETYLWLLAFTCSKGRTLHSFCYLAAGSLVSVNPSYHRAHALIQLSSTCRILYILVWSPLIYQWA